MDGEGQSPLTVAKKEKSKAVRTWLEGVLGLLAFEHLFGLPLETANPSTRVAAVAVGATPALPGSMSGKQLADGTWVVKADWW